METTDILRGLVALMRAFVFVNPLPGWDRVMYTVIDFVAPIVAVTYVFIPSRNRSFAAPVGLFLLVEARGPVLRMSSRRIQRPLSSSDRILPSLLLPMPYRSNLAVHRDHVF